MIDESEKRTFWLGGRRTGDGNGQGMDRESTDDEENKSNFGEHGIMCLGGERCAWLTLERGAGVSYSATEGGREWTRSFYIFSLNRDREDWCCH